MPPNIGMTTAEKPRNLKYATDDDDNFVPSMFEGGDAIEIGPRGT